jgi:hypothetical protein
MKIKYQIWWLICYEHLHMMYRSTPAYPIFLLLVMSQFSLRLIDESYFFFCLLCHKSLALRNVVYKVMKILADSYKYWWLSCWLGIKTRIFIKYLILVKLAIQSSKYSSWWSKKFMAWLLLPYKLSFRMLVTEFYSRCGHPWEKEVLLTSFNCAEFRIFRCMILSIKMKFWIFWYWSFDKFGSIWS